jgi:hypothetical protein
VCIKRGLVYKEGLMYKEGFSVEREFNSCRGVKYVCREREFNK